MSDRMSDVARLVGEKAQLNALVEQLSDTARVALELQMAAEAALSSAERRIEEVVRERDEARNTGFWHEHNWQQERDLKVLAIEHCKTAESRLASLTGQVEDMRAALQNLRREFVHVVEKATEIMVEAGRDTDPAERTWRPILDRFGIDDLIARSHPVLPTTGDGGEPAISPSSTPSTA